MSIDFEDIVFYIIGLLFIVIVGFLISLLIFHIYEVHQYNKSPYVEVKATLIESRYCESTLESHAAPIINGGKEGTSVALYSTGHSDKYITIWDTKEYGRLMSENKTVWRLAKPESILHIKMWLNSPYIDDIKRPEREIKV